MYVTDHAALETVPSMVGRLGSEAQADSELRRLVREKAGLTRVATIVTEGVPAAELFAALTQELVHALEVRRSHWFATRRTGRPSCSPR